MSLVKSSSVNLLSSQVLRATSVVAESVAVGSATIDGSLTVSEAVNASGSVVSTGTVYAPAVIGQVEVLTGSGEASIQALATAVTSDAAVTSVTLAGGQTGQIKYVLFADQGTAGDTVEVAPSNGLGDGKTSVTLAAVGDAVTLLFVDAHWFVVGAYGTVSVA